MDLLLLSLIERRLALVEVHGVIYKAAKRNLPEPVNLDVSDIDLLLGVFKFPAHPGDHRRVICAQTGRCCHHRKIVLFGDRSDLETELLVAGDASTKTNGSQGDLLDETIG